VIADISLGDIIWGLVVFFFMVVYLIILFSVVVDLFRDDELSGWAKAGWALFLLILPLISVVTYLIVRSRGMGARAAQAVHRENVELDRQMVAARPSPVDEISRAKELLDAGAITRAEFDGLKAAALHHAVG